MTGLNENEIELISAYIRQKGVEQDELHDDLLDHICTGIENRIQQGDSFEDAFQYTITLFGPGGVKQVQMDTFELLTEINVTMKKVTLGFGLTSTILLLAGTSFKLLHWPGAGIMITLGAGFLVLGYFPLLLRFKLKEAPGNETLMHLSGYLGITLATLGVLFKIMHWPGANIMLLSGLLVISFLYVPIYFIKKYKSSVNKPVTLSAALVSLTSLALIFALTQSRNSSHLTDGIAMVEWQLRESATKANANSLLYERLRGNQEADRVQQATKEAVQFLTNLRTQIIMTTEGVDSEIAANTEMFDMHNLVNREQPTKLLFSDSDDQTYQHTELVRRMSDFRNELLSVYPQSIRNDMAALFPVSVEGQYKLGDQEVDWAQYYLRQLPAFTVISGITKLQYDIRQAENQALIFLLSQPAVSGTPG